MSEPVIVALFSLIGIILGGAVMWYVQLKTLPADLKIKKTQETGEVINSLKKAIDLVSDELELSDRLQERVDRHRTEIETLKGEIAESKQQIEALNRNYARELLSLRRQWKDWYAGLKKWLDEKSLTGYPEPPADLLDTGKHETIKGDEK